MKPRVPVFGLEADAGNLWTDSMIHFHSTTVKPCLQVEPGCNLRDLEIQRLLSYLRGDPRTSSRDLAIVKTVLSGSLCRHPAVQGVLCACMNRVHMIESGNSTFRNRHRSLAMNRCVVLVLKS